MISPCPPYYSSALSCLLLSDIEKLGCGCHTRAPKPISVSCVCRGAEARIRTFSRKYEKYEVKSRTKISAITVFQLWFFLSGDCEKFLSLTDKKERHLTCVNTLSWRSNYSGTCRMEVEFLPLARFLQNACMRVPDQNVCMTSRSMWELTDSTSFSSHCWQRSRSLTLPPAAATQSSEWLPASGTRIALFLPRREFVQGPVSTA